MRLEVDLPDDIASRWEGEPRGAAARMQLELALHLYASRQMSVGRAAEFSGVSRADFEKTLAESGIVRNYSMDDLESDLAWANDSGTSRSRG